jgi:hypothetical protein
MPEDKIQLLRHTVATLAYRGRKVLRGAPPGFETFRSGPTARTPGEILAHLGDLLDWAFSLANGQQKWQNSSPIAWDTGAERFFRALEVFDARLADGAPLGASPEKLFQGPLADSLTHVGQIALLRRLAGAPVRGENYLSADITAGRVGADQPPPNFEFD